MRKAFAVMSAFVWLTVSSPAQEPSRPIPNADRLRCGVDSLESYLVRGSSRQRTGVIIDTCAVTGTGTQRTLTRVYRATDAILGSRLDTIVDSWPRLEPRSYHSVSSRDTVFLDWSASRLRGKVRVEGKPVISVDEVADTVYNAASFDLILRASPLASNYSVVVPAYIPGRGVVRLTAKVGDEENVHGQNAWRVDADFMGMPVTFWIGKATRQLLRQVMHVAPNVDIEFVVPPSRKTETSS
ncbi:MAG: hypothetical protein ACREMS_02390 [Gemmatimonadaceae bacterium]